MKIQLPAKGTYPEYFDTYIGKIKGDDLVELMLTEHYETIDLITSLDEETLQYRYETGKWTIREIIQHLIDTERIFTYRALRIARNDKTEMPGFDENYYADNSMAVFRDINDLVREFSVCRASTVELLKSMNDAMLDRTGTANGKLVSARALMFAVLGHEIHHRGIIEERYVH